MLAHLSIFRLSYFKRLRSRLSSDQRLAGVFRGSVSNVFSRGLTLLVNIVTLPLTLHYLGAEEYGVWVTVSTSVAMLAVLDLGIANTLTNFIAEAYAEDDTQKAMEYFATAFWVTTAIVVVLVPVCWELWHIAPWESLFHLAEPKRAANAAQCVAIAAVFFLISLPLNLGGRVLSGYQQSHFTNYFNMLNSVLNLISIVGTIALRGTLVQLMAAYCASMLVGTVGLNCWLCLVHKPGLMPHPRGVRRTIVRRLFTQGFLFFVIQLTGLVVFNSDNLVVTHYLGAEAVTPYSIAWRLTLYAGVLQSLLIPSLWPAFTEAYRKGQMEWINNTYRSLRQKTLSLVGVAGLVIGLFGQTIIRSWVGSAGVPDRKVLWLMALFAPLMAATTTQALLLTATSRLVLEASAAVLAAACNLFLSIVLVQRMGTAGVILATVVSFFFLMLIPQAWEVKRVLAGRYLSLREFRSDPSASPEPYDA